MYEGFDDHLRVFETLLFPLFLFGDLLHRLATVREGMGLALGACLKPLEQALDADPYHLDAARLAVALLEEADDPERLAVALERLAVADPTEEGSLSAWLRRAEVIKSDLRRAEHAEGFV